MLKRRKKSLSEYSTGELVMFRFRKNKLAMFGVFLLAFVFLAVLAAPILSSYENVTKLHISDRFTSPNPLYIFGTDEFGRDLFARVLYGGRISLLCSFAIIGIAFVAILSTGTPDALAMAIITAMGNGVWKLVVALAISQVARFARIVRSSVLTLRNVEFVEAAKCYGCSSLRIILKHILPNGIGPIIVSATLCLGQTILSISSMGYLGLGVASPTPEWGTIISENKINIQAYPYLGLIPGICICLTVMAVNFIGDGLRDAFDPRTKK